MAAVSLWSGIAGIDLVTVFDAILTSRQTPNEGGWLVAENYEQTLENKEGLKAVAILLNFSEHR